MANLPGVASSDTTGDGHHSRVETIGKPGSSPSAAHPTSPAGEEQALESHEVIELQSFSERKAWIEEKIKFLEALPPIEVFVGLDAVRASAEEVPELPTREQLQQMVAEHDAIEKETEIFDKGELKKLRQLTKAATQRNLSPEDTDVIELTLTTIYELDKLLHLLRDRSENLEMMAIRLTWEENRQAGWRERRQITEDLHTFSVNRARWSPAIYETSTSTDDLPAPTPHRRASIASQASASSDNSVSSPAFSRTARFKLAELLSRDAAQFSGRVTSLRHGKVAAAGKALDKLIDHSRKPVPDELLDEQDRFEEKCITELENIGKFTLSLVMQWRKADEIYVETMKDHTTASNLLEEIETAKLYHPTARQSTSFISRIDTILKRLAVRGDPASPVTLFPRPEHFLFPDQKASNGLLIQKLSADIAATNKLARKVDQAAKEYRTTYEAVKQVELLLLSVNDLTTRLDTVNRKYREGVSGGDGDGSPPDLNAETVLDPTSHNVFLALLPTLLEETDLALGSAEKNLRAAPLALMGLDIPSIDHEFKENAAASIRQLSLLRDETLALRESISKRVARLKESRRISSSVDSKLAFLKSIRMEMARIMDENRWRQETGDTGAPPTPESPSTELNPDSETTNFEEQLENVSATMKVDITDPLDKLSVTLEPKMQLFLKQKVSVLQSSLQSSQQMLRLLGSVQEQFSAMNIVRDDFHRYLVRMEDAKIQITGTIEGILRPRTTTNGDASTLEIGLEDLDSLQKEVQALVNGLSGRVPFISRHAPPSRSNSIKSPHSPRPSVTIIPHTDIWSEIPFDFHSVDAGVRADSNSYAMRLNGGMDDLMKTKAHLDLALLAKTVDGALALTTKDVDGLARDLSSCKESFATIPRQMPNTIENLGTLMENLDAQLSRRPSISRSLSPIRDLLRQMDDKSQNLSSPVRDNLYQIRLQTVDDTALRISSWDDSTATLKRDVSLAIQSEARYQEELRLAEEQRRKDEAERLAAEEAERLQLEKRRLEEEEAQRILEMKLVEEHLQELERQRLATEQAEMERLEREAAEAERVRLEEQEKRALAARVQAEQERLAKEEEEKALREQERLAMLEKLQAAEAKLEQERRLHAESERAAMELARKQQMEMDELSRRQTEMQRLAEERAHQEELARLERERERLEREENEKMKVAAEAEERERATREALEKAEKEERMRLEREKEERVKREEREKEEREEKERLLNENRRLEMEREDLKREKERLEKEEKDRIQREKVRLEKERLESEERARLALEEKEKLAREEKEKCVKEEKERLAREKERIAKEEQERLEKEELLARAAQEQQAKELKEKESIRQHLEDKRKARATTNSDIGDVFGVQPTISSDNYQPLSQAMIELQGQILSLRKRLRSICINESLRPMKSSTNLPTSEQFQKMARELQAVSVNTQKLPLTTGVVSLDIELQSLRTEVEESASLMQEVKKLVNLHGAIQACDNALSDLLEHVDSYPAPPLGVLSSPHKSLQSSSPEEQLSTRLVFTRGTVDTMATGFATVANDRRAISEHARIEQTWSELNEMALDRIGGRKSRPGSVVSRTSSGRNSSASSQQPVAGHSRARKVGSYSNLSVSSTSSPSTRGKMLAPPQPSSRRAASNSSDTPSRSTSRLSSVSTNRSVSGPLNSSLSGSTYASRQRTTSLSTSPSNSTPRRLAVPPSRSRLASENKRTKSPTMSEHSATSHSRSFSRSTNTPSRTSLNSSTWSRAPRESFSSILPRRSMTPQKKTSTPVRKKYIADPKSKLDVAVGDVVNQLPVGINIEGITETWRDQSGKYWIGNQDPKLCFCRILRSQTVMVRVGGGWTELSRFIQDHFAESFRIAPESPPRAGGQEERWISSASLLEARGSNILQTPPRTPEPILPFVPSFSLMTPGGQSPRSLKSSPSNKGSPGLTPLQFIRRAEPDLTLLRPTTPSKAPLRPRVPNPSTHSRNSVWRP